MKTFFVAFALGLLAGSILTAYFSSPDAYEELKRAQAELLEQDATEEKPADAEVPPPVVAVPPTEIEIERPAEKPAAGQARPEVAALPSSSPTADTDSEVEPSSEPVPPVEAPNNAPEAPTTIEKPAPQPAEAPPSARPSENPTESDAERPLAPRVQEAVETGAAKAAEFAKTAKEKASEIAEDAKDKASELAEDAKPYFDQSIDIAIAAAIRAQYKLESVIDSGAIKIDVKNREVTLTGTVESGEAQQLAIAIAAGTKGVVGVKHQLAIAPAP